MTRPWRSGLWPLVTGPTLALLIFGPHFVSQGIVPWWLIGGAALFWAVAITSEYVVRVHGRKEH